MQYLVCSAWTVPSAGFIPLSARTSSKTSFRHVRALCGSFNLQPLSFEWEPAEEAEGMVDVPTPCCLVCTAERGQISVQLQLFRGLAPFLPLQP